MKNYSIAVIGGGNIGTQFACVFAAKGYRVNLYSSKPWAYNGELEVVDEYGSVTIGRLNKVSDDLGIVTAGCQIIFVTYPAFLLKKIADDILPYISKGMCIGVIPGTGGAEFAFKECIKKGAVLFGLQRVPAVSRLEQYGKRVRCEGLRSELFLASIPKEAAFELSILMESVWGITCTPLPNYLCVTLTPSNPILHTTRLRTLFADYENGKIYDRNPMFYGEWSDASSELLIACDSELQGMIKRMNQLDLSYVRSLRNHYESETVQAMTCKIRSIQSLHNIVSPMKRAYEGWIPDFGSRYFTADFPYGLALIEQMADVLELDVPNIRNTMDWYQKITGDRTMINLKEYGIYHVDDIYAQYR